MKMNKRSKSIVTLLVALSFTGAMLPDDASARPKEDPDKYYRAPGTLHGKTVLIPIGSHIEGRMNQTISSRKSKSGQKFSIEITSPVLANGSDVVIPIGSRIIGEVVEAIPSSRQRKVKGMPKPLGKLRTQLTLIKTPDGVSHPLIASISAEFYDTGHGRLRPNQEMGRPNLGYAGSAASFSAVHPSMNQRGYQRRGPKVVSKRDYWRDPIMGVDKRAGNQRGAPVIRSMVRKGRDIYIFAGSPLTIRIDAPLKISIAPSRGRMSIDLGTGTSPMVRKDAKGNYRRFQPVGANTSGSSSPQDSSAEAPDGTLDKKSMTTAKTPKLRKPVDPEAHLPRFLRTPKNLQFLKPAPFSTSPPDGAFPKETQQSGEQATQQKLKPVKFSPAGAPVSGKNDDF